MPASKSLTRYNADFIESSLGGWADFQQAAEMIDDYHGAWEDKCDEVRALRNQIELARAWKRSAKANRAAMRRFAQYNYTMRSKLCDMEFQLGYQESLAEDWKKRYYDLLESTKRKTHESDIDV